MCGAQMNVRDALNSAIDEEMSADSKVFVIGEEVRSLPKLSVLGWKIKHLQC
jgi:pyruvate/2-oxoglutarate/acetoin dehydrogenase E1 component